MLLDGNAAKATIETQPPPNGSAASSMPVARTLSSSSPAARFDIARKHLYLLGIGGCGMSGLARMLAARGAAVSGSDLSDSDTTQALERERIHVDLDQSKAWLPDDCDLVVASAAIRPDHPQMLEATRRGIETLTYAEALGRCMIGRTGVCVAGTHGKSTTTAMLGCILQTAGMDPTVIVGATCSQLGDAGGGGGFRLGGDAIPGGTMEGKPGILVAESCEFNRSFHNYHPVVAAVTSVEADHLDIYGTLDAVVESFAHFAKLVAPAEDGGVLLIAHDGAHRREVTAGATAKVETIGYSPAADWVISFDPHTRRAELKCEARKVALAWTNNLPGEHNATNGATAAALAMLLGAQAKKIEETLTGFRGVDRRCQFLGERPHPYGGVVRVYDDYGHHPTEVEATLRALRQFEAPEKRNGRLICVFQPHQHSRTRHLLAEFASAFDHADVVIVPHIYFVRDSEEEKQRVTAGDLVDRLREKGVQAMHLYPFEAIIEQLESLCRPGDLLVVMGAGPVNQVAHGFLKRADAPANRPQRTR
jgi:UDP-N-acetylmuramate--alanine ligase